jgi:hypothetical protein
MKAAGGSGFDATNDADAVGKSFFRGNVEQRFKKIFVGFVAHVCEF